MLYFLVMCTKTVLNLQLQKWQLCNIVLVSYEQTYQDVRTADFFAQMLMLQKQIGVLIDNLAST